jgi:16S rRNA (cytosine967-C5)-methyltransferase
VEIVRRWLARHGRERTEAMLRRNAQPPPLFVRVNRLRATREDLIEKLRAEVARGGEGARPESVRVLEPPADLIATKAFAAGLCTVQDETAMAVAPTLAAEPGQLILDLCAAPGGKATHLAELTGDRATLVAVDVDPTRVERVRESAARLGLTSVRCVQADSRDLGAIRDAVPTPADRVLLDAPCSNSGVIARRPEARSRLTEAHLNELAQRQRVLLDVAAHRLASGGLLAYSTCSIEPEENEAPVRALLARNAALTLISMRETLPEQGGGDGGFVALLRRRGA